ncbi:predicted protein [Nematostella vectensis]|uniref:G-protein coupled receptors family 1 profile domain-containing protein n=1 Tax=Nematostella vectensis TaxID=45351 RepID=A7RQ77_NEMVE|nr:predicted protein [Nematostella vectensis]|eukprot:XP_001638510.1 predicted protein [Nematostella vectensis]
MEDFEKVNLTFANISSEGNQGNEHKISWVKIIFIFIILICGFILNSTVIFLVLAKRVKKKTINVFVVNMSVADLCSLLLYLPWRLKNYLTENPDWQNRTDWAGGIFGDVTCKLISWFYNSTDWVSLVTLLIISVERFRAVKSIVQLPGLSRCKTASLISFTWILSGFVNLPLLIICGVRSGKTFCGCPLTKTIAAYYMGTNSLYVCLVISILSINLVIIRRLVRVQASYNLPEAQQVRGLQRLHSAVRMVLCSLVLFVVCTAPFYAILTLARLEFFAEISAIEISDDTFDAWDFIFYVNAAFGPVIYFIFLDDFRDGLKQVIRGCVRSFRANTQPDQPPEQPSSRLRHKPACENG